MTFSVFFFFFCSLIVFISSGSKTLITNIGRTQFTQRPYDSYATHFVQLPATNGQFIFKFGKIAWIRDDGASKSQERVQSTQRTTIDLCECYLPNKHTLLCHSFLVSAGCSSTHSAELERWQIANKFKSNLSALVSGLRFHICNCLYTFSICLLPWRFQLVRVRYHIDLFDG